MKDKPMIGYARVSTDDQDLTNQRAELHAAGCTRIFAEKITGTHAKRPELGRMLDHLRAGDVVTVTRLDRLARTHALVLAVSVSSWAVKAFRLARSAVHVYGAKQGSKCLRNVSGAVWRARSSTMPADRPE